MVGRHSIVEIVEYLVLSNWRRVFILVLIWLESSIAHHGFKTAEEENICRKMRLVEISPYRTVSNVSMTWTSADICCKMRGRVLHTVEKLDEFTSFPLRKVLPERVKHAEDSIFWIGLSFRDEDFHWTYGASLRDSYRLPSMREKHKWAEENPRRNLKCVGISPRDGSLVMYSLSCNSKFKFICQKLEKPKDEPLSGHDVMMVGAAKFLDVKGFSNLKFSKVYGGWSLANAVCQSRNWALIDSVHENYGEALLSEISSKEYLFEKSSMVIHTAANDFCEPQKWQWNCGKDILKNTIPWSQSVSDPGHHQNNLKERTKRCIQYFLTDNGDLPPTLAAKNVRCQEEAYIICDTTPECERAKQYPCLHKDPYYIDTAASIHNDMKSCSNAHFQKWDASNNSALQYWVSATKLTWAGAMQCCNSKGWRLPSPRTIADLESLAEKTIGAAPSALCRNEKECDGIWTSTSTQGFSPFSPLRFSDGRVLPKDLYNRIRADAFTYPSCGRINFMSFDGTGAKYFHANCLEKNFLVCESTVTKPIQDKPKFVRSAVLLNIDRVEKEDIADKTIQFNRALHDRFNSSLNSSELVARDWELQRGRCLGNIAKTQDNYANACPNSASSIFSKTPPMSMSKGVDVHVSAEFQNRFLLSAMLDTHFSADKTGEESTNPETQAFQLLSNIAMIYSQICPIVPANFITKVSSIFKTLYFKINPTFEVKPNMMSKDHFRWTLKLLTTCMELVKPVDLRHDLCGDMIVSKESCSEYVCTDPKYEFNVQKADLLVDFMWKMFEAIHAACFPAFQENPLLHHKLAMSVVDLWESSELRFRWSNQVADKKFWYRLLGSKFELHLINMERCNDAIIKDSMFHVRLPRNSVPPMTRIKGFPYENL